MALSYRPVGTRDLLFVERLIREMMPTFSIGQEEVRRLLGRQEDETGLLLAIEEGGERVGVIGAYAVGEPPPPTEWHLVGPFLLAPRRERLYLPTIVRRAMEEAHALGATTMLAHRLEGAEVPLLSSVWPTVGNRAFYAWRGVDLLEETGFGQIAEAHRLVLSAEVAVAPGRVPPPCRIRPYAPSSDAEAALAIVRGTLGQTTATLRQASTENALVAVAGEVIVGVVDWSTTERTLRHLAVVPGNQGRGLGRALLTHAVARLRQGAPGVVRVEVDRDNARAIALFRSAGFRHESTYASFACVL